MSHSMVKTKQNKKKNKQKTIIFVKFSQEESLFQGVQLTVSRLCQTTD